VGVGPSPPDRVGAVNRAGHRLAGASAGAGFGLLAGLAPWQTLACAAVAAVPAGGRTSPDMDQTREWKAFDALVPRCVDRGQLAHRHITHWLLWPVLAAVAVWWAPHEVRWVLWAAVAGWASHPILDRGWSALGFRTGRAAEDAAKVLVLGPVLIWLAGVAFGWPASWPVGIAHQLVVSGGSPWHS
jgi:membrane-bound metal-dependent hydrolase YbcI (DUF457 family)